MNKKFSTNILYFFIKFILVYERIESLVSINSIFFII